MQTVPRHCFAVLTMTVRIVQAFIVVIQTGTSPCAVADTTARLSQKNPTQKRNTVTVRIVPQVNGQSLRPSIKKVCFSYHHKMVRTNLRLT